MSDERLGKDEIFNAAAELSNATERQAYLNEVCADDPQMLREIEDLLALDRDAGSFLESPPPGLSPTLDQPITERPGTVIGPYKLLQEIGQGGMGVVYMAEQTEPVCRKVALKIIKPGMDTRQVIARFEAERQALSLMDHPNIARVLDAGTTDSGRPYFVMELVKGLPITQYCDEHHLTPRARLELLLPVCQAIQHAHQKGIIHRDIKPSNILVAEYDEKPVPKVIDFGVAKAISQPLTEKTVFTGIGQIVGTLEYMSPEQAKVNQLDIDTRSDIYSLGVLLYELLTGTTPVDKQRLRSAAWDEMLRIIREEEPPKPSTRLSESNDSLPSVSALRQTEPARLTRLVRGELDWIVMKALEKDRTRRYETANGLANDIQRYLNDEPVAACPPSAVYRFRKFARRNKTRLSLAITAGVVLLLVVAVVGWAIRDRQAREDLAQQERAARQLSISLLAEQALADSSRQLKEGQYREALGEARRAEAALVGGVADNQLRQRVTERIKDLEMVGRLEQISFELSTTALDTWFDYADCDVKYAQAFREYGIDLESLEPAVAAEQIRHRAVALELAVALDAWVDVRRNVLKPDDTSWQRLVAVAKAADPDPDRSRLRSVWGEKITEETQQELARLAAPERLRTLPPTTLYLLAKTLNRVAQPQEALRVWRQAQQLHPGNFWINHGLGLWLRAGKLLDQAVEYLRVAVGVRPDSFVAHNELGCVLFDAGRLEEAVVCYRRAMELAPRNLVPYMNLGEVLEKQGRLDEAIVCYRKLVEVDPKNGYNRLGSVLLDQGEVAEAIDCHRKALEICPGCDWIHVGLGKALLAQGELDEAGASFRRAIELNPKRVWAHVELGKVLKTQGKLDEAIKCFRTAVELEPNNAWNHLHLGRSLKLVAPEEAVACLRKAIELDPSLPNAYAELGDVLKLQGTPEDAVAVYRAGIELEPTNAALQTELGKFLVKEKKLEEAIVCFRRAIELDPKKASFYHNLGLPLQSQGNLEEAITSFRRAVELDPKSASAHTHLGVCLRDQGKLDESVASFRKAVELDPKYANAHAHLGIALRDQGATEEAIACFRKAIELDPKNWWAHRDLAGCLANADDVKLRNPQEALKLARKAVQLKPDSAPCWNMLSLAAYRSGDWKASLDARQEKLQRAPITIEDRLFLAMIYWQLREEVEGRKWYHEAIAEIEKNKTSSSELAKLREETEQLLGIDVAGASPNGADPPPDKPQSAAANN